MLESRFINIYIGLTVVKLETSEFISSTDCQSREVHGLAVNILANVATAIETIRLLQVDAYSSARSVVILNQCLKCKLALC